MPKDYYSEEIGSATTKDYYSEEIQNLKAEPRLGVLGKLKKSFQDTGVGLVRGVAEPILKNVIARPVQGLESMITGKPPIEFNYPFPESLGGPIKVDPIRTLPQAVGAGAQTAALALGPTLGGAMYMGGGAMEQGKSAPQVAGEALLGGSIGKLFGLASGESLLTGKAGEFIKNRIAPSLKSGAEKSYRKVLGATTKAEKLTAEKLTPRLAEEKPFVFTRGGLLRASERKQVTAGENLSEAYSKLNPKDKVSIRPILDNIDKAKNELSVKGVLLEQNKSEVKVLDQLRQDLVSIAERGKTDPITLREYRQQLDGYIAARKKGFALSDADSSALNARRIMANSIRKELAVKYPDIAKINAEFSFQNNMVNLLESTVQKQKGPLSEVGGMIGDVAGNKAAGLFIRNLGSLFSDNVAWNSLAGSMKSRLAGQLAKGNIEAANFTLIGAMNEWNKKIGQPTLNRLRSQFSTKKPVKVYGSQDEYLGGLWKDAAERQPGTSTGTIPARIPSKLERILQSERGGQASLGNKGSTLTKSLVAPVAIGAGVLGFNQFANASQRTPYERITKAETGSQPDPWIRTKATGTGSSAFGEVQITKGLVDTVLKNQKTYGLDKEDVGFLTWLSQQQTKMLKYGGKDMVAGMEKYDYGRKGDWQNSLIPKYRKAVGKILSTLEKKHGDKFWRVWRYGEAGAKNSKNQDKRYEREFRK